MAKANFFRGKKKKSQTKTPKATEHTPPLSPHPTMALHPSRVPPSAESAVQSRPDRSRRTANGTPGSAKAQKCERGAQSVKLPCLLEGGGTLTYIYPMGDGYGGGTVTQFGPMRQTGGGKHMALRVLPAREGG